MEHLLLKWEESPGDTLSGTAAVENLARQFPGEYQISVQGYDADAIYRHNPHVIPYDNQSVRLIPMKNCLLNKCNQIPVHVVESWTEHLARELGINLCCNVKRPFLYLSQEENNWQNMLEEHHGWWGQYALMTTGIKDCYHTKGWGHHNYQAVVDHFRGKILFVQVGSGCHSHKPLKGTINLIDQTPDARMLFRLAAHPKCQFALCGETYLHHIMAALEKKCVMILSGGAVGVPLSWVYYPGSTIPITRQGMLPCCDKGPCGKSKLPRTGKEPKNELCTLPVLGDDTRDLIPRCMDLISPEEVCRTIEALYLGGVCRY